MATAPILKVHFALAATGSCERFTTINGANGITRYNFVKEPDGIMRFHFEGTPEEYERVVRDFYIPQRPTVRILPYPDMEELDGDRLAEAFGNSPLGGELKVKFEILSQKVSDAEAERDCVEGERDALVKELEALRAHVKEMSAIAAPPDGRESKPVEDAALAVEKPSETANTADQEAEVPETESDDEHPASPGDAPDGAAPEGGIKPSTKASRKGARGATTPKK